MMSSAVTTCATSPGPWYSEATGADRVYHNYDVTDDGIYCRRRLALTAETQRQLRIGNFIARLHHPVSRTPNTGPRCYRRCSSQKV